MTDQMANETFRRSVANVFWNNAQVTRSMIFGPDDPIPAHSQDNSNLMWAGYVGRDYQPGGLVLVAHFPAGGTTAYEDSARFSRDAEFYGLIRSFKLAADDKRLECFEKLNSYCESAIARWNMYRVISLILKSARASASNYALINLVPYRMAENRKPRRREIEASWQRCTEANLRVLEPAVLCGLGAPPSSEIKKRWHGPSEIFEFKRRIGDFSIHPEAQAEAERLARHHFEK